MLTELSVVEQRHRAVLEVEEGARIKDVALSFGVDRKTVYRWLVRYAREGIGALANQSCKPASCPHQIPSEIEVRIIELRREHPMDAVPSRSLKLLLITSRRPFRSSLAGGTLVYLGRLDDDDATRARAGTGMGRTQIDSL